MVRESFDKLNLTVPSQSNYQLTSSRKPQNQFLSKQGGGPWILGSKIETVTNKTEC